MSIEIRQLVVNSNMTLDPASQLEAEQQRRVDELTRLRAQVRDESRLLVERALGARKER